MRTMFGTAVSIAVGQIVPVRTALGKLQEFGLDAGLNDGTIGTWMGIQRSTHPMWSPHPVPGTAFMLKNIPVVPWNGAPRNTILIVNQEIAEIIRKLQEDKDNDK
jgi:hypothetical protein